MSEEDRDIDVESDDVPDVGVEATASTSNSMDFEVSLCVQLVTLWVMAVNIGFYTWIPP